jgi:hypothetical protein
MMTVKRWKTAKRKQMQMRWEKDWPNRTRWPMEMQTRRSTVGRQTQRQTRPGLMR